jgi:hypothetical protein
MKTGTGTASNSGSEYVTVQDIAEPVVLANYTVRERLTQDAGQGNRPLGVFWRRKLPAALLYYFSLVTLSPVGETNFLSVIS